MESVPKRFVVRFWIRKVEMPDTSGGIGLEEKKSDDLFSARSAHRTSDSLGLRGSRYDE
jgi:hypothetical protein